MTNLASSGLLMPASDDFAFLQDVCFRQRLSGFTYSGARLPGAPDQLRLSDFGKYDFLLFRRQALYEDKDLFGG